MAVRNANLTQSLSLSSRLFLLHSFYSFARLASGFPAFTNPPTRATAMPKFLLKLSTEKIEFASEKLGEEACTTIVKIKNTQNEKYLYKIKSTSNELFNIHPVVGYIKPGEAEAVMLIFKEDKPVPESYTHSFSVFYRKDDGDQDPYEAWSGKEPEGWKRLYISFIKKKKEEESPHDVQLRLIQQQLDANNRLVLNLRVADLERQMMERLNKMTDELAVAKQRIDVLERASQEKEVKCTTQACNCIVQRNGGDTADSPSHADPTEADK